MPRVYLCYTVAHGSLYCFNPHYGAAEIQPLAIILVTDALVPLAGIMSGILWQRYQLKSDLISYMSVQHYQLQIHWPNMKSFSLPGAVSTSQGANGGISLSSQWSKRHDLAVNSPRSNCSLWAHHDILFSHGISTQIFFYMQSAVVSLNLVIWLKNHLPQTQNM